MEIIWGGLFIMLTGQFFQDPMNWSANERFNPPIKEVYVPYGFDDNDLTQVIVEVEFRDTCEEIGRAAIIPHDQEPNVLMVYVEAHKRDGFCLQILNRQIKVVDVGILPEGNYKIRSYNELSREFSDLRVRRAKSSRIDDSTYAPVDSMIIQNDPLGLRRMITLSGTFTNTCLNFESITIAKTRKNLIEVLPVVRIDEGDCKEKDTPFLVHQAIPDFEGEREIKTGRYLFHIRTMNGGSFNKADYLMMNPDDRLIPD